MSTLQTVPEAEQSNLAVLRDPAPVFLVIDADRAEQQYWADLWRYRELFYFLAWRDILVRYKQTAIGVTWSIIRPLLTTIIFTFIFSRVAHLPSDGAPYPLFVLVGTLPWNFFSTALAESSSSLITNANMLSKVYFPRLIVPTSALIVSFVDFLISFAILLAMMVYYRDAPTWRMLTLPLFVLLAFAASLGPGLWLAALNVKYRDFRYIVPFLLQFGLYISPVGYSSASVHKWRLLYSLNPMVSVIDGFRWAILGHGARLYWPGFTLSVTVTIALLITGLTYFRRMERSFADLV